MAAITMHQAQQIRTFIRDLEDIDASGHNMPDQFLADQGDDVRVAAWKAALDCARGMVKAQLRALGVMA